MRSAAILLMFVSAACAQTRASLAATFGYATFLDESSQNHVTAGAAARVYFTRRTAVEPELTYMYRSQADKDVLLQANLVRDLGRADGRVVPFLTAGAGRLWNIAPRFTVSTWTGSGGGGFRYFVTERFFVAPEVRIGSEPVLRIQMSAGWATR